jgi:hypothetical protein
MTRPFAVLALFLVECTDSHGEPVRRERTAKVHRCSANGTSAFWSSVLRFVGRSRAVRTLLACSDTKDPTVQLVDVDRDGECRVESVDGRNSWQLSGTPSLRVLIKQLDDPPPRLDPASGLPLEGEVPSLLVRVASAEGTSKTIRMTSGLCAAYELAASQTPNGRWSMAWRGDAPNSPPEKWRCRSDKDCEGSICEWAWQYWSDARSAWVGRFGVCVQRIRCRSDADCSGRRCVRTGPIFSEVNGVKDDAGRCDTSP